MRSPLRTELETLKVAAGGSVSGEDNFPKIHYYDQDFVDLYNRTWEWVGCSPKWGGVATKKTSRKEGQPPSVFAGAESLLETCLASFSLVYGNRTYPVATLLDSLYARQEECGAIRSCQSTETDQTELSSENSDGVEVPLLAWAEYNLFHKAGQKDRVKEVIPNLERYYRWLESTFLDEEVGLYSVPLQATLMPLEPRREVHYPLDFNLLQAINALYMAYLGDILNDKEVTFRYKRRFYVLKSKINSLMWDNKSCFYYDLDRQGNQVKVKTVAAFWAFWAEILNEDRARSLLPLLKDPKEFGTKDPFPILSASEPTFEKVHNNPAYDSRHSFFTFVIVKGLEKYGDTSFARECAVRHVYGLLDALYPGHGEEFSATDSFALNSPHVRDLHDCALSISQGKDFFFPGIALATVTLMIENIVGIYISLPRKTVDWVAPTLEIMGIENLSLHHNSISILSQKGPHGWEIRLESEKLYYFTVNIAGRKKKTIPAPSGRCSVLVDKL